MTYFPLETAVYITAILHGQCLSTHFTLIINVQQCNDQSSANQYLLILVVKPMRLWGVQHGLTCHCSEAGCLSTCFHLFSRVPDHLILARPLLRRLAQEPVPQEVVGPVPTQQGKWIVDRWVHIAEIYVHPVSTTPKEIITVLQQRDPETQGLEQPCQLQWLRNGHFILACQFYQLWQLWSPAWGAFPFSGKSSLLNWSSVGGAGRAGWAAVAASAASAAAAAFAAATSAAAAAAAAAAAMALRESSAAMAAAVRRKASALKPFRQSMAKDNCDSARQILPQFLDVIGISLERINTTQNASNIYTAWNWNQSGYAVAFWCFLLCDQTLQMRAASMPQFQFIKPITSTLPPKGHILWWSTAISSCLNGWGTNYHRCIFFKKTDLHAHLHLDRRRSLHGKAILRQNGLQRCLHKLRSTSTQPEVPSIWIKVSYILMYIISRIRFVHVIQALFLVMKITKTYFIHKSSKIIFLSYKPSILDRFSGKRIQLLHLSSSMPLLQEDFALLQGPEGRLIPGAKVSYMGCRSNLGNGFETTSALFFLDVILLDIIYLLIKKLYTLPTCLTAKATFVSLSKHLVGGWKPWKPWKLPSPERSWLPCAPERSSGVPRSRANSVGWSAPAWSPQTCFEAPT